jgi:hypothetical protein
MHGSVVPVPVRIAVAREDLDRAWPIVEEFNRKKVGEGGG